MTGIATVAAIKHQRRQSPAERRHPDAAGGDGYRSGPMARKAYPRRESTSGSLSSNGRSNLVPRVINLIESHGGTPSVEWWSSVSAWSLGWVSARNQEGLLVGFVNVAREGITGSWWTPRPAAATNTAGLVVSSCGRPAERQSRRLRVTSRRLEPHLARFYPDACRFQRTDAGLIHLPTSRTTG